MSVFVVAICGIIYELIIGTLSSYLFGSSVTHFSITIGLFMSAMGIGAFLSKRAAKNLLTWFVAIELGVGLVGGLSAVLLYAVFATTDMFHVAMVVLILITGSLIGMEIPILTRMMGGWEDLKDTLSNILAIDYLGALLASIVFPLVLLPRFGVLTTAFVTGLLNAAVVMGVLWTFRDRLPQLRTLSAVTVGLVVVLASGAVGSDPLSQLFERSLYADQVIYSKQTPYQRIVMTRWGEDVRLFLDGNLQFSTRDEYRYHEALVHPAMSLSQSREQVLVLGGGDGLAVRDVLQYDDVRRVVLVDLDPAMTELGRTYPPLRAANADALHDPRVEIIHQDAFTFLTETSDRFGVILIDLPDPNNEGLGKLYSTTFYDLVHRHLGRGGAMATQATSPYFARRAFWSIVHTVGAAGFRSYPYHVYVPSFGDWGFVLATEHMLDPATSFSPKVPMRFLTPDLFRAAFLFDSDTAEVPAGINTLDDPILLTYYDKDWNRWR